MKSRAAVLENIHGRRAHLAIITVVSFFTLPDTPKTTWWLSPHEKQLAHDRMIADTVEKQSDVSIYQGLKQALRDKYVWIFAVMHHIHTATSGFRSFLPTLLDTLGYDTTATLALTCPPYILASAVAVGIGLSSGKYNERTWHLTGLKFTAMLGFVLGCASMNTAARLVAAFLFVGWTYGVTSLTLGWLGVTCGQTKEKRAASLAFVNTFASASQIWAPVRTRFGGEQACQFLAWAANASRSIFGRTAQAPDTSFPSSPAPACAWSAS